MKGKRANGRVRIVFTLPVDHERAERPETTAHWMHVPREGEEVRLERTKIHLLNSDTWEVGPAGGVVASVCWVDDCVVHIRLR